MKTLTDDLFCIRFQRQEAQLSAVSREKYTIQKGNYFIRTQHYPHIEKEAWVLGEIADGRNWNHLFGTILDFYLNARVGQLSALEGNYAIVLADHNRETWHFIPCLLGTIPFYFYHDDANIVVATRISSILKLRLPPQIRVNPKVACAYVAACKLDFDEDTIFVGINSIPQGYYLEVDLAKWDVRLIRSVGLLDLWHRYAEQRNSRRKDQADHHAELLWQTLKQSTDALLNDMDVTCFELSSGIDSPGILAAASDVKNERFQTRSIVLEDARGETDSEGLIQRIARRYNTLHKTYRFSLCEATEESLLEGLAILETPTYRPSTLVIQPEFHRLLAREGFRYAVSGFMGGTLFVGFPEAFLADIWQNIDKNKLGKALSEMALLFWRDRETFKHSAPYVFGSILEIYAPAIADRAKALLFPKTRSSFRQKSLLSTLGNEMVEQVAKSWMDTSTTTHIERFVRQSLVDCANMLRIAYKTSLNYNILLRLPYCSPKMVEFAFAIPYEWNLQRGYTKCMLRRALRHHLPPSVVWNRKKYGFWPHVQDWFNAQLGTMLGQWLSSPVLDNEALFNLSTIRQIREAVSHKRTLLAEEWHVAWRLACLAKFAEIYNADMLA